MVFPSEQEQIEKFEKDHVAQHYFEVLRTLISTLLGQLKKAVSSVVSQDYLTDLTH